MAKILITGMAGSLAQLCGERLINDGHDVIGVDYRRKPPGLHRGITFYRANYNKTKIADIFRKHKPQKVFHLGRVGNLKTHANKRFDLNVIGSNKIMELSLECKVKRLVVLSTFHIYGAHPHNHIPIAEEEPLRAAQTFPQLADAVQLDNQAAQWIYRHRTMRTVVLRPCNIVGPHVRNAISTYLRSPTLTYLWGFSPMWQFIHEADMLRALILTLESDEVGVFNVAGAGGIPIVEALELTRARLIPVPAAFAEVVLRLSGSMTIPAYFLDFLKYPCVISDAKFREATGYEPEMGIRQSIESTVHGA